MLDVAPKIGRHSLQPADRNRFSIQAPAAAGRLAGSIAGAAKNRREHIRLTVEHVGIGVPALRNEPYVFRNVSVRGTRPLAVHDSVEVIRVVDVSRFHELAAATWGPTAFFGPPLYTRSSNRLLRFTVAMIDHLLTEAVCQLQLEFHVRPSLENVASPSRHDNASNFGSRE